MALSPLCFSCASLRLERTDRVFGGLIDGRRSKSGALDRAGPGLYRGRVGVGCLCHGGFGWMMRPGAHLPRGGVTCPFPRSPFTRAPLDESFKNHPTSGNHGDQEVTGLREWSLEVGVPRC